MTETSWSYLFICYSFAAGHSEAQRNPRAGSGAARLPSLLVPIACGLSGWDSQKPLSSLTTDFESDNLLHVPHCVIFTRARQWDPEFGFGQHGCHTEVLHRLCSAKGSPGSSSGEDPTGPHRRRKRCGFHPWVGKMPCRRTWQPTPVFLPGKSHGQRSLAAYSPWGGKVGHDGSDVHSMYAFSSRLWGLALCISPADWWSCRLEICRFPAETYKIAGCPVCGHWGLGTGIVAASPGLGTLAWPGLQQCWDSRESSSSAAGSFWVSSGSFHLSGGTTWTLARCWTAVSPRPQSWCI